MVARVRRIGALIALIAFSAGLLLPGAFVLHAPDDADAAWGAPGLVAGHPVTQVEPERPSVEDEHCAICHWMRALTHSITGARLSTPQIDVAALPVAPAGFFLQSDASSPSPARAPPALPLSPDF
jgi:hypothetical protein